MDNLTACLAGVIEKVDISSRNLAAPRQQLLADAAKQMTGIVRVAGKVNLLFVCTHNSRRSQFSEFWAQVALVHYDVEPIHSFSCGTEATECNVRTVDSLRRAGFEILASGHSPNPVYRCRIAPHKSVDLFSKSFGHQTLPLRAIVAMMCCDDADRGCPVVPGCDLRVPLHYRDPKESDGTDREIRTYDERSMQIAAEMFFLIRTIRENLNPG